MTIYLNPAKMTKEEFLQKYGKEISRDEVANYDLNNHKEICVVCLVDNGPFRAAGIIHGQRDLEDFTRPDEYRPRKFYEVSTTDINNEGGPDRQVS